MGSARSAPREREDIEALERGARALHVAGRDQEALVLYGRYRGALSGPLMMRCPSPPGDGATVAYVRRYGWNADGALAAKWPAPPP
ncbi:hypothetical protein [Streptomyces sp. NPDC048462]|uniref:hypothetical protein n=1 Tax=Streptomyces sp. NPDC048462 TaxID=3365555 RepID=UPI003720EA20